MKRALIFSLAYQPYVGGAELAIKEITDRLDPKEFVFDMITLCFDNNLPKIERVGNVMVHRIGWGADHPTVSDRALPWQCRVDKMLFPFTSFWKALSLNRQHRYDFIWAMMANQAGFGALLFKYTHPEIPYLLELQDGNSLEQIKARRPFLRLLWGFYKAIYRKADVIKAISHFIEKLAREIGFGGSLVVIPNGVDIATFSAPITEEDIAELKAKLHKHLGDVFLFTASRLVLSRGIEDVIRALVHLPPHMKFLIAGDGEDRGKLERIAKDVGVDKRVIFAGHIDHAELPAYLRVSDMFVRPSRIEGMGSSFIEAFAAGIPVVATPVGGIPDFLSDPDRDPDMEPTGLFCEVRNPESIARAVKRYMNDPMLVARIVKNAKELVVQKYDWDIIVQGMRERIFEPLTGKRG